MHSRHRIMYTKIYIFGGARSVTKTVSATDFKAKCLRLINDMREDGESVTITNRGRAVAILSPAPRTREQPSLPGALRGSVLGYDDPYLPAADSTDRAAAR